MEGEVNLGMIWNGSGSLHAAGTPIDVVWPKRGGISGWTARDPGKCQKQRRRAEIDQLPAAPGWAKQVAETIGYPTPNLAARKLLSPEVANDKTLYPDAETIKMANGRMTLAQPAAFMKSIIRS